MPERFSRLVIMNTWLHHDDFEYTPGALQWIEQNKPGGMFRDNVPSRFNWGTLMAMATGRVTPQNSIFRVLNGEDAEMSQEAADVRAAYDAPFVGLGDEGVTGPRRFPLSIPVHDPVSGNAPVQQECFAQVNATSLPVHFVWGTNDNVFVTAWGKKWHGLIKHSTWDEVPAGHFLQDTHGAQIVQLVLGHASDG